MFDEEKLQIIRECLRNDFPEYNLADKNDFDRIAWTFRLTTNEKIYLITIGRDYMDDRSASEIKEHLTSFGLRELFNDNKIKRVTLKTNRIEKEA
ncbi:MAG: hypothetical protein HY910_17555 [Desulfarculus sp.]|nr:hypothetical protein [Desulfarculus sp.]